MNNDQKLISFSENGVPFLRNNLGVRWEPSVVSEKYGLGTFFLDGLPLGSPVTFFFEEESVGKQYQVNRYKILENTSERGKIQFYGRDGKLDIWITAEITSDSPAITFTYVMDPIHPLYHPIFTLIPFFSEKAIFLKYPYEDTLSSDFRGRWAVNTDISRVPVVFGCENLNGKFCYLSAGYHLDDAFDQGRFEIDCQNYPNAPFKIFSQFHGMARALDLQCITELELLRVDLSQERKDSLKTFRFIVSAAETQYDCLKGYMDKCGYTKTAPLRYTVQQAVDHLMDMYKYAPGYIPGKGYTQLIRTDTGRYDTTVPHGWYSKDICPGPQVQLGYELYRYWQLHREETWARKRAFEMADFLVQQQLPSGQYGMYNTDTGAKTTASAEEMQSEALYGFFYNIGDMNLGAYHLYMLYHEVLQEEGIDKKEWKEAAQKCIRFTMNMTGPDGSLGRNYNANGQCDKYSPAISEALLALDYMYRDTHDESVLKCQLRIEHWLYHTFIQTNDYADGCMDGGAWVGDGTPPKNNDAIGIMGFMCYCTQMYQNTGEERYLNMAKDAFAYQWSIVVPIQIPGFTHATKGLVREQDFYSAYDLPMRINDYVDCLPYLSKVTGDPIFMQFFKIILQTEMDYQEKLNPYKGIHIGLECSYDGREPIDKVGERNSVYIIRFAALFLKAVRSPIAYQYVGGPDWGIGLDYNLPFNPCLGDDMPYILSCTGMVRNYSYEPDRKQLHIWTYDTEKSDICLEICWNSSSLPIGRAYVITPEAEFPATEVYDPQRDTVTIFASNKMAPSKKIDIIFR